MESGACGKPLSQAADTTLQRALGDPVSIRRRSYSHFEVRLGWPQSPGNVRTINSDFKS